MSRKGYDEATRLAFLRAVTAARAAGQPWVDAFKAAQAAGYTGTLGGIAKMFCEIEAKKARGNAPAKRGRLRKTTTR